MLLVVGTRNVKKRGEILDLIGDLGIEVADLSGYPNAPEVEEDGATFEANARKKAAELAKVLDQWVLGEDSGLVVPGLGGQPGIYSARYAGGHGDDDANNAKLLTELASFPQEKRAAFYVCACAVADPSGVIRAESEGHCHGVIAAELRGRNGFGYDPLFLVPEYHRTFGELSPLVKRVLSHRARALGMLRAPLRQLMAYASEEKATG